MARIKNNSEKFTVYLKMILLAVLVMTEIAVIAQAAVNNDGHNAMRDMFVVCGCCTALLMFVAFDSFAIKKFALRMLFFGAEIFLLLVICIFTGNSLLSTLYCVILTQLYLNLDRFSDKLAVFGVSCAMYAVSFIVGWVLTHAGSTIFNSAVEIVSGVVFGLLVMIAHFFVVQFLLRFYKTNRKLAVALKEADDSRERLEEAYQKLKETAAYEERNRIARDIHDNAGHSMTTVIMQTEAAKLLIDSDPEEAKTRIISANLQAKNALEQMRESVHLLAGRQSGITLKEQLGEIIAQTSDGTDIKVRYNFEEVAADEETSRFLCNTLKECLSNGIRHGKATAFFAELGAADGYITLLVSDNGVGTDGEFVKGFGLNGICSKAEELCGHVEIHSEKDEGFELKVTLPLKNGKNKEKL